MGTEKKVRPYTALKTVLIELETRLGEPYRIKMDPKVWHQAFYDAIQKFPEMDSSGVVKRDAPYCHGLEEAIAWSSAAGEIGFIGINTPENLILLKPEALRKAAREEPYASNRHIGQYICDRIYALEAEKQPENIFV